jgi:hypothetical protein
MLALSAGLGLVGCSLALVGCSRSFDSLPRPVLLSTGGIPSNCTSTVAIDARGDIWTESGCEARSSGVVHRGQLTASQRGAFRSALEAIKGVPDIPLAGLPPCSQPFEHILLRTNGEADRQWYLCGQDDGRRPPPFNAPFDAMNAP